MLVKYNNNKQGFTYGNNYEVLSMNGTATNFTVLNDDNVEVDVGLEDLLISKKDIIIDYDEEDKPEIIDGSINDESSELSNEEILELIARQKLDGTFSKRVDESMIKAQEKIIEENKK